MSRSAVRRLLPTFAVALVAVASVATSALAQGMEPARGDSAGEVALPHKSAAVAGVLATVLPGAGHVDAGEGRRGLVVFSGMAGLLSDSRTAALTRLPLTVGMTRRPTATGQVVRAYKVGMRLVLR